MKPESSLLQQKAAPEGPALKAESQEPPGQVNSKGTELCGANCTFFSYSCFFSVIFPLAP